MRSITFSYESYLCLTNESSLDFGLQLRIIIQNYYFILTNQVIVVSKKIY